MDVGFCVAPLEEALARFGRPEIFNTGQAIQLTRFVFISVLSDAEVRIKMDGRDGWMDNVFIERLWRSMKYECVYLHAFEIGSELRAGGKLGVTLLALPGGSPITAPSVRTRALPGEPRSRPVGGSENQIMLA